MTLDDATIDAIARRVVEHLARESEAMTSTVGLVDTATLARRLGVEPRWVRDHADELGVIRLGDGPRARMKFDLEQAMTVMRERAAPAPLARATRTVSSVGPDGYPPIAPRRRRRT